MSENFHKGHRQRLKEQIVSADIGQTISPEKLLEMLLFYGIPQKDTVPMARELLRQFGDFNGVLEANIDDITKVKGVTRNAASLIKLMLPIIRTYVSGVYDQKETLKTNDEIGDYITAKYFGINYECVSLLSMNNLGKVLSFEIIAKGSIDSVGLSTRLVAEKAMQSGATAVVVAHNHPGGIPLPSPQDIEITEQIAKALSYMGINLIDHIIISDDDYISMALSSEFRYIFGE